MFLRLYLVHIFVTSAILCEYCKDEPIIETIYGKIRGSTLLSRDGKPFQAFKSIPYGKPPIGELRFKNPVAPEPWEGTYSALDNPPTCAQKNYLFGRTFVEGTEDCLYLNVYSPHCRFRKSSTNQLLPVMVFIHWGGFFAGYSNSHYLGPEYFMDQNVVLVTFNYRLGVLGFLSTADDASPGNYGLKDQQAALLWVRDNIENFGGDKNQVTLFGQSAGGASVHYHMFSRRSKGLFHRAISESGTALSLWAKPFGREYLEIAKAQANFVGCGSFLNSTYELVECLRNVDVKTLINSGDKFKYFSIDPLTMYLPSIETKTEANPNPFITKYPIEYIQNDEFTKVPWIMGTVSDEGIIRAAPLVMQLETLQKLNQNFNELMPTIIALAISTPKDKIKSVWSKIRNYYFEDENLINTTRINSIQGLVDLYTDRSFAYSVYQTALLHSKMHHEKIWMYMFEYKGKHSYRTLFAGSNKNLSYNWGVSHCDELLYLFNSPAILNEPLNKNDKYISKVLLTLWTDFAKFGNPTPHYHHVSMEVWPRIFNKTVADSNINKKLNYLHITGNYNDRNSILFKIKNGYYKNSFKLWEELPLLENIEELNQKHVEL